MELYQGKRFWPTLTKEQRFGQLHGELKAQYVVIGGGMSGMLAAFHLAQAGHSVVVVEQARVAQGSSSVNTGLIQYMSDKTLTELARDFSPELAISFYNASREALHRIEAAASLLGEEVSFSRNHSLYATADPREVEKIREEAQAQQAAGFDTSYLTAKEALDGFGINVAGALISKNDVEINPMAFVLALAAKACQDYGLIISEGTRVEEGEIDLSQNKIITRDLSLGFDRLILATGYEFYDFAKAVMPQAKLITTFAAVTAPLAEIPAQGYMFWESSAAYAYFRKSPDRRLIMGGGDEADQALDLEKAEEMANQLCRDISGYLRNGPQLRPEYYYEAIFGESGDGLPYIGPHPDHDQVYLIHGVGGNGTVYSAIAAGEVLKWARHSGAALTYLWPGQRRILE